MKKQYTAKKDFHAPHLEKAIGKGRFKKGELVELEDKEAEMFEALITPGYEPAEEAEQPATPEVANTDSGDSGDNPENLDLESGGDA